MALFRRPCLDCGQLGDPGQSRCPAHLAEQEAKRQARYGNAHTRRRQQAPGDGAALRLRRRINRTGHAACAACGYVFEAAYIQVDHVQALSRGGRDDDLNVRPLCRPCHADKTANERRQH